MNLREIIDIVAGCSKFADTLHETLPQNISSIFAIPGKIMDLRTRLLFRILIPFLNVSNDNGTFPAIPADALPDVSVSDCQGTAIICGNASCTLSVSSYRRFPPVSERTPRDFSCSYRGGRKRINGRHRKEAICHDSCQRIYDRYGTLSFFSYCNRPDLCHASGRSSTGTHPFISCVCRFFKMQVFIRRFFALHA